MTQESDDMFWINPAPDASAPSAPSGKFGIVTIGGVRTPIITPNAIEPHLVAIRDEFKRVDQQQEVADITISRLNAEIVRLNQIIADYKLRCERAETTITNIRGHL